MRVGIISDVHAQPDALLRALGWLETLDVALNICAGDLVDKGPDDLGVINLRQALKLPCVRGNHDRVMLQLAQGWPEEARRTFEIIDIKQGDIIEGWDF